MLSRFLIQKSFYGKVHELFEYSHLFDNIGNCGPSIYRQITDFSMATGVVDENQELLMLGVLLSRTPDFISETNFAILPSELQV